MSKRHAVALPAADEAPKSDMVEDHFFASNAGSVLTAEKFLQVREAAALLGVKLTETPVRHANTGPVFAVAIQATSFTPGKKFYVDARQVVK